MAEFKFRLATLLRLREQTRDERRAELATSRRADERLRSRLHQMRAELCRLESMAREAARPGAIEIPRLVEMEHYQQTLVTRQGQLNEELAALAEEIERRREALLAADRDVRMLEKLRDAQVQRHRLEAHRLTNKQLDEATQLRVAVGNEA